MRSKADELLERGFVHVRRRLPSRQHAWETARELVADASETDPLGAGMPPLAVVGEFTIPPVGALRRHFQALHIDFGLPIAGDGPVDVARFTALHIGAGHAPTTAVTRLMPLARLLGQRTWPDPPRLMRNLRSYGNGESYVEGILARLVEAADGRAALPSVSEPGFLCGMEFYSLAEEREHFRRHGLDVASAEQRIRLAPGELLVFDNLTLAHGRAGTRAPEELHQLCVGYRALGGAGRRVLRDRVLSAFSCPAGSAAGRYRS